jgi:hypothetical protein
MLHVRPMLRFAVVYCMKFDEELAYDHTGV